ncbi:Elongation factor 4 [Mycoplasmopsis agalactiae]|uniref:Elongation factor 4 n=4 Tax=Mycoplasmopsis agalactiae TaxID=2110 RepID=LEPA_MYCAP|nr:translation elongation factor 4 [Mycoplasmopsis agalactiae]A5IYS0.1 RecName: Full=Elongation factor 4; Short=EF-4; AltName: Full=Ribosomal back-translocase LepA [Mycoplasmopsis agalactiae PG2]KAB6718421.1 elongation factor 4 [Mycoplasmopsis agalactiae]MCE6057218.1 translation elongation factor 4 [Mycoplasmopsis agalactiae]MCE6061739.1 translation elongation factor 4 [Mycoplasmopsis agalactiae]MCE6079004.1 translation elongation factor 4 [Mycoplasmopsis agalactiae]MCE6091056.1 translation e
MDKSKIRNFSIIAHIDHGKSTLADRILELTNTVAARDLEEQFLDQMDLERERGITIKLNAVQIKYKDYTFHLIDTPGHVDFTYEVSRSLAASEGALLLVDATQGIEAQTLANVYLALENNLEIIPIINKIDLPSANVEKTKEEIENVIGIPADNAVCVSAKTGLNCEKVLDAIVDYVPAPKDADDNKPLKALIFDSYFDEYRGVIMLIRVFQGKLKVGDDFKFMSNNANYHVIELGVRNPKETKKEYLEAGEVGYVAATIRDAKEVHVGDTITLVENPALEPLPGYKRKKPVLFTGFYPIDTRDYAELKKSLDKISLSDSSLTWEQETSKALGFGFRVGFLGMLHMDVIQERLSREYKVGIIATSPSVEYKVVKTNGTFEMISNPSLMPDRTYIDHIEEPYIEATIILPNEYIGNIMDLCQNKRGIYKSLDYIDDSRSRLIYEMPLGEIVFDFFDKMKSLSKGYASFEYDLIGYKTSDLVKVDILLNGDKIDAFSIITHKDSAYEKSRDLTKRLKDAIPRQNFEVPVQATIGGKIIARETIKAFRKDVTHKLHASDISRYKKLLEKQKAGKKKMKMLGSVEVPQEAFLDILKTNVDK